MQWSLRIPRFYPAPGAMGPEGNYTGPPSPALTAWAKAGALSWAASARFHDVLKRLSPDDDPRPISSDDLAEAFDAVEELSSTVETETEKQIRQQIVALRERYVGRTLVRQQVEDALGEIQGEAVRNCMIHIIDCAKDPQRSVLLDHIMDTNADLTALRDVAEREAEPGSQADLLARQLALFAIAREAAPPPSDQSGLRHPLDNAELDTRGIETGLVETYPDGNVRIVTLSNYLDLYRRFQHCRAQIESEATRVRSRQNIDATYAELEQLALASIAADEVIRDFGDMAVEQDEDWIEPDALREAIDDEMARLDKAWLTSATRDRNASPIDPESKANGPSLVTTAIDALRSELRRTNAGDQLNPGDLSIVAVKIEHPINAALRLSAEAIEVHENGVDRPDDAIREATEQRVLATYTRLHDRRRILSEVLPFDELAPLVVFDEPEPPDAGIGVETTDDPPDRSPSHGADDPQPTAGERHRGPVDLPPQDSATNPDVDGPPRARLRSVYGNGTTASPQDWMNGFAGPDDDVPGNTSARRAERPAPRGPSVAD